VSIGLTAAKIHQELRRLQPDLIDMRAEAHLEPSMIAPGEHGTSRGRVESPDAIERFEETPVRAREIPPAGAPSELRYFLDGAQRTLLAYLVDGVPILTCIGASAILERDANGSARLMPGTLRFRHHWLVPTASRRPGIDRAAAIIAAAGGEIADPLAQLADSPDRYQTALDDYAAMVDLAYQCGSSLREQIETELLNDWQGEAEDGWIVVDGALRVPVPRAVGLVKSFTRQYLTGPEAMTLFRLPPRSRTSAFLAQDKWREGRRVCWYQRFWDASGRDVRHALVRVETNDKVASTEAVDRLAAWLWAERLPRATADQRWATLLYPIHFLEQILKRKIDAETRGWPAAR
jgi:hypothetical protein